MTRPAGRARRRKPQVWVAVNNFTGKIVCGGDGLPFACWSRRQVLDAADEEGYSDGAIKAVKLVEASR